MVEPAVAVAAHRGVLGFHVGADLAPAEHALALGAALALELTGRARDAAQGLEIARQTLADGRAAVTLEALGAFFGDGKAEG